MLAHNSVRWRLRPRKNLGSRRPYRQKRPTTSGSDVRLSCSDRDHVRSGPRLARPGAAARFWGIGARVLQRVPEYHIAPPGLTAKRPRKSSIFSRALCRRSGPPIGHAGLVRSCSVYRCISGRFSSNWAELHDHGTQIAASISRLSSRPVKCFRSLPSQSVFPDLLPFIILSRVLLAGCSEARANRAGACSTVDEMRHFVGN